uniref:Uncharacterized protein n=1 Tax=Anguilla anguilla TaxID=7936 RepID=A0A0E9U5D3_ANGAN
MCASVRCGHWQRAAVIGQSRSENMPIQNGGEGA